MQINHSGITEGDRYFIVTQYNLGFGLWGYKTLSEARNSIGALDIGMWKIKTK